MLSMLKVKASTLEARLGSQFGLDRLPLLLDRLSLPSQLSLPNRLLDRRTRSLLSLLSNHGGFFGRGAKQRGEGTNASSLGGSRERQLCMRIGDFKEKKFQPGALAAEHANLIMVISGPYDVCFHFWSLGQ